MEAVDDKLAITLRAGSRAERSGRGFQLLCLATALATLGLIALGSVVRVTGSGLGCPDWPLCHGRPVPPLEVKAILEYSHRMAASLVGVLVIGVAVFAWVSYRKERWILYPATLGVLVLVAQALLGGVTVLRELPPGMVMAHLATSQALVACMVVTYMVARDGPPNLGTWRSAEGKADPYPLLVLVAAASTYGLMLSGSYVIASGASTACGQSWPLCLGRLIPEGYPPLLHLLHRAIVLLVGVLVTLVLVHAWRRRHLRPDIWRTALVVGGLFLAQVFVGAFNVWLGFPLATKVLHLSTATAVWGALCALSVAAHTRPQPVQAEGVPHAQA